MIILESKVKKFQDGEITRNYYYRMTKDKITIYANSQHKEIVAYGLEIERQDLSGNVLTNILRDQIKCISPSREKVHRLMEILYENMVSPIHLVDILGEEVDLCVNDFEEDFKNIVNA